MFYLFIFLLGDPVEFLSWFLNSLHTTLGGTKKSTSSKFGSSLVTICMEKLLDCEQRVPVFKVPLLLGLMTQVLCTLQIVLNPLITRALALTWSCLFHGKEKKKRQVCPCYRRRIRGGRNVCVTMHTKHN